jgi:histone deacetylase 11
MIIDLDAHQGNGHERDYLNDPNVYILDIFTHGQLPDGTMFYPDDALAMSRINLPVKLAFDTRNDEYLQKLSDALNTAKTEFSPDIIYYVAGADILEGDALGKQKISLSGLIERDEKVFSFARELGVPIVTMQAGGYQPNLGSMVADSIENLHHKFDLF